MSRILMVLCVVLLSGVSLPAAEATTASSQPATTQPANDYERIAQQTLDILDRATAALATVKDEATAKEAAAKLTDMKKEVEAMKATVMKLGQPSDDVQAALMSKYAKSLEGSYLKLVAEGSRVHKQPALEAIIEKPLVELGLVQTKSSATTTTAP